MRFRDLKKRFVPCAFHLAVHSCLYAKLHVWNCNHMRFKCATITSSTFFFETHQLHLKQNSCFQTFVYWFYRMRNKPLAHKKSEEEDLETEKPPVSFSCYQISISPITAISPNNSVA